MHVLQKKICSTVLRLCIKAYIENQNFHLKRIRWTSKISKDLWLFIFVLILKLGLSETSLEDFFSGKLTAFPLTHCIHFLYCDTYNIGSSMMSRLFSLFKDFSSKFFVYHAWFLCYFISYIHHSLLFLVSCPRIMA